MTELELTRAPDDRRRYDLGDLGRLRFEGLFSRSAMSESGGNRLRFAGTSFFSGRARATDAAGTVIGEFDPRALWRGGTIHWSGTSFALRPASGWRERYALADGDRELAVLEGKGWGRRPVRVQIDDASSLDPSLLLFAAFVVRGLAEDASGASGAGASTAATG